MTPAAVTRRAALFAALLLLPATVAAAGGVEPPVQRLRLLSLNTWLLPPPLAPLVPERVARLRDLLRRLDPDVVALQEVWRCEELRALVAALPGFHWAASGNEFYNRGGLLLLSRWPLAAVTFTPFPVTPRHSAVELAGGKGMLRARLHTPAGPLDIIDTHLYAATSEAEQDLVEAQFLLLRETARAASAPLVVAGDLNLRWPRFCALNDGVLCTDGSTGGTTARANAPAEILADVARPQHKIDYVLLRLPAAHRAAWQVRVLRTPRVSDHLPLLAQIALQ